MTEHRSNFYKILNDPSLKYTEDYLREDNDTYSLGAHLVDEHRLTNKLDFDSSYTVFILNKNCCRNSWVGGSFISRPWLAVHNMVLAIANYQLQTGMQVCSLKLKVRHD